MKQLFRRVFGKSFPNRNGDPVESPADGRTPELETLEPRMLFSSAPVEAPDEAETQEQAAEESLVTPEAALDVAASVTSAESTREGLAAGSTLSVQNDVAPRVSENSAIDAARTVTLIELDEEAADLNRETLDAIAEAAADRWRATGLTAEQSAALDNITYEISDLGGNYLGKASGFTISVDDDAAGYDSWFVDATPGADEEFLSSESAFLDTTPYTVAERRFDLLSVVLHEQGHVIGVTDLPGVGADVMNDLIGKGIRRLPLDGQGGGAIPGAVVNEAFVGAAPDIELVSVEFVDLDTYSPTTPLVGEQVYVKTTFQTNGLPAGASYRLEASMDGVPLSLTNITSGSGAAGTGTWYYTWGGWHAGPGPHTVVVTVDADNTVAESDEANNSMTVNFTPLAPTDLPEKFVNPMGGVRFGDWSVVNYYDVDPTGSRSDFQGDVYNYNSHNGHDLTQPNFANMDAGVPLYAAAGGTVVAAGDGNFDRNYVGAGQPANFVEIDHGAGWKTQYYHFAANSITVQVGDTVVAGQLLGLSGSSGNSSDSHLHFGVLHNNLKVEPNYDPTAYFVDPLPIQSSEPTTITDMGITNFSPSGNEYKERPAAQRVFSTGTPESVQLWFRASHFHDGDQYQVKWYRPDGTLNNTYDYTVNTGGSDDRYASHQWTLSSGTWSAHTGEWRVAVEMGGVEIGSRTFEVTTGAGAPGIKITESGTIINDNRTTAHGYGSVASGGAAVSKTFTVENHGTDTLNLSSLELPPGFSLNGAFPATVAAGATETFTIDLDTTRAGDKFGAIQFTTDDPDSTTFNFNVSGEVTGAAPAGAPVLDLPGAALAYTTFGGVSVIDSTATVTDSDSADFNGGNLTVAFSAISSLDDVLGIRNVGTGVGEIGVSGSDVTFGGAVIGSFSGGTNGNALAVNFNAAAATPAAAQELVRNITFSTVSTDRESALRFVRFTVEDAAGGNLSNQPVASVVQDIKPTTVYLDGSDLRIEDTSHNGVYGNWSLGGDGGTNLTITDLTGNSIDVSAIAGAIGHNTATVTIPLAAFSGSVLVNPGARDDTVTFDSTFDIGTTRGVIVDGGDLNDTINWNATAALDSLAITAETVNVGGGISANSTAADAITLTADSLDLSGGNLSSSGGLTIKPQSVDANIGLGGGAGTLNLDDSALGKLAAGFSSITIGDTAAGTGIVDIESATFLSDVNIAGATIHDGVAGTDIAAPSVTLIGTVSPGQSPGILVVDGDFTFDASDTFSVEIGGITPGSGAANHDQIQVIGNGRTISLNGAVLDASFVNGFTSTTLDSFKIIEATGTGIVLSGTFKDSGGSVIGDGDTLTIGGRTFEIDYRTNAVVLTDVQYSGSWVNVGPAPTRDGQIEANTEPNRQVNGAIHTVLAHPTNADILYIGSVNGGIWRTDNATALNPTWTPQTENNETLSIGAMAFDPTDATSNTLVAGTARYSSFGGTGGPRGNIYITTDGGATWTDPGSAGLAGENISGISMRGSTIIVTSSSGNGGLFRSTDGGANFTELSSGAGFATNDNFTDLVEDLSDPAKLRVYAVAEAAGGFDPGAVFRSDDFGATWAQITGPAINADMDDVLSESNNVEMTVHPTTGRLYVAVLVSSQPRGVFYSDNPAAASPTWVEMDVPILPLTPTNPFTVAVDDGTDVTISATAHGLESGDFVVISGVTGNPAVNDFHRVTVADPNEFVIEDIGNGAVLSGGDWTQVTGPNPRAKDIDEATEPRQGGQGRTHFSITVDPANHNLIFIGGDRQERPGNPIGDTTFGGAVFRGDASIARDPTSAPSPQWDHITHDIVAMDPAGGTANGSATHADSREMVFDANGNLIEVDDGGIYRRTSPGDNTGDWFSVVGNLNVIEFHDVAYNTVTNTIIGGTQDNGTHVQVSAGNPTFTRVQGGDGGDVLVDTQTVAGLNQAVIYTSSQNLGGFTRRTFDAANKQISSVGVGLNSGGDPAFEGQFDTPLALNNVNANRLLLAGENGLYESLDQGDNIARIATFLTPDIVGGPTGSMGGNALAYGGRSGGLDNEAIIYAGDNVGNVHVRTTSGGGFAITNPGGGGSTILDIVMDPDEFNTAFAVDDNQVFMTNTTGSSWSDITGNIASIGGSVIRTVEYVSGVLDAIVVGTNTGVFASLVSTFGTWFELGTGMPNVPVFELVHDAADNVLVAGTMGRGAWLFENVQASLDGTTATTNITLDGGNNLVITDTSDQPDNLTIQSDTTGNRFIISDTHNRLFTTISGASGNGTNTVIVPFASIAGANILVNTEDDGDSLTVDYSLGNFSKEIQYDGGSPTNGPGDRLSLTGGGTFTDLGVTMTGTDSGTISVTGNSTITFTGLEPVTSSIDATNVTLTYTSASETIGINPFGVLGQLEVTSTAAETVVFNNPTGSLTINGGDGDDVMILNDLGPAFDASLTVDLEGGTDDFTLDTAIALSGGSVSFSADTLDINESITTTGAGSISLIADRQIEGISGETFQTVDGNITLKANEAGTAITGDYRGVDIENTTITSVNGDILIVGRGGDGDATDNFNYGVKFGGSTAVTSTGTGAGAGTITIRGTGGDANEGNRGFQVNGSSTVVIESKDGDIVIAGTGGDGSAGFNRGVIFFSGTVRSTGIAEIAISGTGGDGTGSDRGVEFVNSSTLITSAIGNISIIGTGGANGNSNYGVFVDSATVSSTGTAAGAAMITITGTGGAGTDSGRGVALDDSAVVTSVMGNIDIDGQGAGTGNFNYGVLVADDSTLTSTGTGATAATITVTGTGGAGDGNNRGVQISGSGTPTITSKDGAISVAGSGGGGTGNSSHGLWLTDDALIESTGTGANAATITLEGTGGNANQSNRGIEFGGSATVQSVDGSVELTGKGGNGTSGFNRGVAFFSGTLKSTGDATLTITGTGGNGTSSDRGVELTGSSTLITSATGNIEIDGQGGTGGNFNFGVRVNDGARVISTGTGAGAATITITGTGGAGLQQGDGVALNASGTLITSKDGAILIEGEGGDGTDFNRGVVIAGGAQVTSTGSGANAATITVNGTGGDAASRNRGIEFDGSADSKISSIDGAITLAGTGGAGTSVENAGIHFSAGTVESTGTGANAATIELNGQGGAGSAVDVGVRLEGADIKITSIDGDVTITGTGGEGGTFNHGVFHTTNAVVESTGTTADAAAVTITGTAAASGGNAIELSGGTVFGNATGTGALSLVGDTLSMGSGAVIQGAGTLTIKPLTGSTSIGVGGGSGTLDLSDAELGLLADGFSSITIGSSTAGTVNVTTATFDDSLILVTGGEVHDNPGADVTLTGAGDTYTVDGILGPGQSPGIHTVSGDFAFADNSTFEVEIGGTSPGTAGTNHDQLEVTGGSVNIGSGVALDLSSFNGFAPGSGDRIVVIDNDATDSVSGVFASIAAGGADANAGTLEEGDTITNFLGTGRVATISYAGGTNNNDVVITVSADTSVTVDVSNNLVVNDTIGLDNRFVLTSNGTTLTFTDAAGHTISTGGLASSGDGSDTVTIDFDAGGWSGGIVINGADGDDSLEINYTGGADFDSRAITFNGQGHTTSPNGDELILTGGNFSEATFNYANGSDGDIQLTGQGLITYTGLEPVTSTITVAEVTLNYSPTVGKTITVTDPGSSQTTVSSTAGETTTFNNPSGTLTINAGGQDDVVNINGLAASYSANLTINGQGDSDTININGALSLGAGKNLSLTGEIITQTASITVPGATTFNTGSTAIITLTNAANDFGGALTIIDMDTADIVDSNDLVIGSVHGDNFFARTPNGKIVDGLAGEAANITADRAALRASTGIGDAMVDDADLDIAVAGLAATTATGSISISDDGTLDIATVDGLSGISITDGTSTGDILLRAANPGNTGGVAVSQEISNMGSGNITVATGGSAAFNQLDIDTDITAAGGDITLVSFGILDFNVIPVVSTTGAGNINVHAGATFSFGGGVDVLGGNGDSDINGAGDYALLTHAGDITLTAPDQVYMELSNADSDNAGAAGNVMVTADVDNNGVGFIFDTQNGEGTIVTGAGAVFRAATGIGSTTGIEVDVDTLSAVNSTSGDIQISTTGELAVGSLDGVNGVTNSGTGSVTLTGSIHDSGSGTDVRLTAPSATYTVDGVLAPGQSPGIHNVEGNFAFAENTTFEIEIGGASPGTANTNHDQLRVTNGGVTIGSNVTFDTSAFNGFTPSGGDTFTLIDNDGADAIGGTFAGLAEGGTIANFLGSGLDALITYIGGTGNNDVVLTVLAPPGTTGISLDGSGNLVIDDTDGGDTDDAFTISADGTNLTVVETNGNAFNVSGVAATGNGTDTVTIALSAWAGGIVVTGQGGNDSFTVGDLTGFGGSLTIDGNAGDDSITQTGDAALTGASTASYTAERIEMQGGSSLATDTGNVTLTGTGGTGNLTGVALRGAEISSTSGNVSVTGSGGTTGNFNRGVLLDVGAGSGSSISTGGEIMLDGTGGSGGLYGAGVTLIGSTVESTGAGPVTITGSGGAGTLFSEGVSIHKGSTVDAGTGDLTITGNGGSAGTLNRGVSGGLSELKSDGGNITIDGTGGGTGIFGVGVDLTVTGVETTGTGTVTIRGTGASGTLGNMGVKLSNSSSVSAADGAIQILGTANGGSVLNHGIQLTAGTSIGATGSGAVTLTGTGGAGTTLNNGVDVSGPASLSVADGDLTITGSARGTATMNRGIHLIHGNLTATGSGNIALTGTGSASATGVFNTGINIVGGGINTVGGNITLLGAGGSGSTYNEGVRIAAATLRSTGGGTLSLTGTANAATGGVFNSGVYLLGVTLDSGGTIGVNGTGGGGTLFNHGIFMQNIVTPGSLPTTDGDNGTGLYSEDEKGNFF